MTSQPATETRPELTTNVHHDERVPGLPVKRHRVKLHGHVGTDGAGVVTWCEHYVDGELKGCGPSMLFTGPDGLRWAVDGRVASLFDGSMLWRAA